MNRRRLTVVRASHAGDLGMRLHALSGRVYEVMNVCEVTETAAGEDNMAIQGTMTVAVRELNAIAEALADLADEKHPSMAVPS